MLSIEGIKCTKQDAQQECIKYEKDTRSVPIATLAKAFVGAVQASYNTSSYEEIQGHYNSSMQIQKDLVEARRGVDYAVILAKRLQVLTWKELRSA
jgi:hypothetical protein